MSGGGAVPGRAILAVDDVHMRFGGTWALRGVSMTVGAGECVALAGQNGAGKSTLVKIVTGVHPHGSYTGTVTIEERPVEIGTPREAEQLGIAVVQQELTVCPTLTVAENLLLGREPSRWGIVRQDRLREEARRMLALVGLEVSLDAPAGALGVAQQQMLEIARAVSRQVKLLVLDEPTASLSSSEAEALFARLAELRAAGVSVLYISHRLDELQRVAERVVVLRDGRVVLDEDRTRLDRGAIVHAMLGEELARASSSGAAAAADRETVLTLANWSVPRVRPSDPEVRSVDLSVRAGEIAGIYGAVGAGRSELLMSLFGARAAAGELSFDGRRVRLGSPRDAVRAGVALVTEDRKTLGLQPWMTTAENITVAALEQASRAGVPHRDREVQLAATHARSVGLPERMLPPRVTTLSGGNQQKALLARALATRPRLLLLDEPTRGVDVGAKADLHATLRRLAAEGLAILWVSSEAEELLESADRIHVMRDGALVASYEAGQTDVAELVQVASSAHEADHPAGSNEWQ